MSQVKFYWDITLFLISFLKNKKKGSGQEDVKYIGRKPRYNALGKKLLMADVLGRVFLKTRQYRSMSALKAVEFEQTQY